MTDRVDNGLNTVKSDHASDNGIKNRSRRGGERVGEIIEFTKA